MSLAVKNLLRMSAVRNALQLCALFIAIMIAAGFLLSWEISEQIHDDIDDALSERVQSLLNSETDSDGIPIWFLQQNESMFVGNSESYLSKSGRLMGPIRKNIFDQGGFRTIPSSELFSERYFKIVQNEFLLEEFEDIEHDSAALEELAESELWRVYVKTTSSGSIAAYTPIHEVEDALELLPSILLSITTIILAATLAGGLVLGLRQQKRINAIHIGLQKIADGDLSHRMAPKQVRDDVDELMQGVDNATQKLEMSVRQLTDFSRNVAHELRTPLTQLRAVLETAKDSDDMARAVNKTEDVIRIFDSIQRISRLGRHESNTPLEPVALNDLASLMADLYTEVAEEQEQRLEVKAGSDQTVRGDWQLLAQLTSNLIENAIRHAGAGARITVTTEGNILSVEDNGPGIPTEEHSRVFEPFYKRDSARKGQGSGLGLALVKAIADYHNAEVSLLIGESGGLLVEVKFQTG
jgi:signal transduction histidine kinase